MNKSELKWKGKAEALRKCVAIILTQGSNTFHVDFAKRYPTWSRKLMKIEYRQLCFLYESAVDEANQRRN